MAPATFAPAGATPPSTEFLLLKNMQAEEKMGTQHQGLDLHEVSQLLGLKKRKILKRMSAGIFYPAC